MTTKPFPHLGFLWTLSTMFTFPHQPSSSSSSLQPPPSLAQSRAPIRLLPHSSLSAQLSASGTCDAGREGEDLVNSPVKYEPGAGPPPQTPGTRSATPDRWPRHPATRPLLCPLACLGQGSLKATGRPEGPAGNGRDGSEQTSRGQHKELLSGQWRRELSEYGVRATVKTGGVLWNGWAAINHSDSSAHILFSG